MFFFLLEDENILVEKKLATQNNHNTNHIKRNERYYFKAGKER